MAFRSSHFALDGRPIIKIAEIKEGITDQTKFTQSEYEAAYFVRPGDMLFSWSGQPETSIDVFWWRGPEGWLNQHIFKVVPGAECDPTFFYYLLRYLKPNFIAIARNKQTTGLGHVTRRDLEAIEVALPGLAEQKAIAAILSALDDKIELNRRLNETLESVAQAIFKYWFLDTSRTSLPKGWHEGTLGEITGILGGYAFKSKDWTNQGVPVVKIGSVKPGIVNLNEVSFVSENVAEEAKRFRLCPGDLLIGMTGYVGEVGLVPLTDNAPLLNQRVGKFVLKEPGTSALGFLYCLTRRREFKAEVEAQSHGTAQANVSADGILSVPIIVPPDALHGEFNRRCEPILNRILANHAESRTLAVVRDTLLPRLFSGELPAPTSTSET
jgi:type I restriction enzyme S subunit